MTKTKLPNLFLALSTCAVFATIYYQTTPERSIASKGFENLISLEETQYPVSPYTACDSDHLPKTIAIKNSFQTFNDYHYFVLVNGRLCFKERVKLIDKLGPEIETDKPWRWFGQNGLPYRIKGNKLDPDFDAPKRLLSISADDDEVMGVGENRKLYLKRVHGNIRFKPIWYDDWGVVKKQPLYFTANVNNNLAWGLGRRTIEGVGFTTGPDGRPYGGGGVSMDTLIFLNEKGDHLYYLDSAITPDINHQMCLPERGKYRALNASYSASTIMVIDQYGVIKTRLGDYDHAGGTYPHRFCYNCDKVPYYASPISEDGDLRCVDKTTRVPIKDSLIENDICINEQTGITLSNAVIDSQYLAHFSMGVLPIALPDEPWMNHKPIITPDSLDQNNHYSKDITILQNGIGNAARELRVVGKKDGIIGYYSKKIYDHRYPIFTKVPNKQASDQYYMEKTATNDWTFIPLTDTRDYFASEENIRWLNAENLQVSDNTRLALIKNNKNDDVELTGKIQLGDQQYPLKIKNSNHVCSPWDVRVMIGSDEISFDLHTVHMWAPYQHLRDNNEQEETRVFQGTIILTLDQRIKEKIENEPNSTVAKVITNYLMTKNFEPFALVVSASKDGLTAYSRGRNKIHLLASRNGGDLDKIKSEISESRIDDNGWVMMAYEFIKQAEERIKVDPTPEMHELVMAENRDLLKNMKTVLKAIQGRKIKYQASKTGIYALNGIFHATGLKLGYDLILSKRFDKDSASYFDLLYYEVGNAIIDAPYIFKAHTTNAKLRLKASKEEFDNAKEILDQHYHRLKF